MTRMSATRWLAAAALITLLPGGLSAQQMATIMGRVTTTDGQPLAGVSIIVVQQMTGAQQGMYTRDDGRYNIPGLRAGGPYRVEARMIGYGTQIQEDIRLTAGETRTMDFRLGSEAVAMDAIEVFAERAVDRQTPVAYSNIDAMQMRQQLASRDLPMILNTKPGVYATMQGGGAGDSRINVRGFSQRNVAVMINGVPVNDMENGWVYWSNWDGVGDVSKSIQLQRGLSAVNLATPSIGGSLNIVTDPASMDREVRLKQEFGNDGFLKTTGVVSTGLINDRFALMVGGVRKTGDGIINGTWTDAWAYYGAATFILNDANRFDLFAVGAPQRHGQMRYAQNIAAYDYGLARDLFDPDVLNQDTDANGTPDVFDKYHNPQGRFYNENWNTTTMSGWGDQAIGDKRYDLYTDGYINESMNFYHKPQINLNWYSQLTDNLLWSTVGYYSGGTGGGTGTYGSMVWDYSFPSRVIDWDGTIADNQANALAGTSARGILRSSRNDQWTIGAISKLKMQVGDALNLETGVDWRTAEIEHYREVFDLLGGSFYDDCRFGCSSDFWNQANGDGEVGLGDKLDYWNTNTVDWIGGHVQGEYVSGPLSAYGMVGLSGIRYTFVDHFRDDGTGKPFTINADWVGGMQAKGGALYNLSDQVGVFGNFGYVSKVPIFDQVISDIYGILNNDPVDEKFLSLEAGAEFHGRGAPFSAKLNAYYTQWKDRNETRRFVDANNDDYFVTLTGLDELHTGVELELAYQPMELLRLDAAASVGNWKYTDDVTGSARPEGSPDILNYDFYIKDLKVGDAPQTQLMYGFTLYPADGAYFSAMGRTYARHFANFNPFDREDPADLVNGKAPPSWEAPGYSIFELHAGYTLPESVTRGIEVRIFASLFNALDKMYISDALDNSQYNAWDNDHDADDAEVYLGTPRTFNMGLDLRY